MPGPLQSGISGLLSTATAIASVDKHLDKQNEIKAATQENTALQKQLAEEAEKKAETEYKANIAAGLKQQEQSIFDEETHKAGEELLAVGRKHPNMSDLEQQQFKVYAQSLARKAGDIAMRRIDSLTESDPYRKIQLEYANGHIANRHEYEQKILEENLKKPTYKELTKQGFYKYLAERSK